VKRMSSQSGPNSKLSAKQRELLERRLMKRLSPAGEERKSGIPRRAPGDSCPLSFAQQRLWFLNILEPGSTQYHHSQTNKITGALNLEALRAALEDVVARHEVLRTTIDTVEGTPVQTVQPVPRLELPLTDLSGVPAADRERALRLWLIQEMERPFDLSRDLMLRPALARLSDEEHVLFVVVHHIASDAWSMDVLLRELADLYSARVAGRPAALGELPIQYADFAVWQRDWFTGPVLQQQLAYWRKQLAEAPPDLELPADALRHTVKSTRSHTRWRSLPPDLYRRLEALSQNEQVTLFMTLLAAFQILLARLSGRDDVVVGSPIAGRNRQEIEGLIGFFVNTLVLRTDLSGNPTFREVLGRVREVTLQAFANQDLPFEKLVEVLHPERSENRTPLFQVFFNMVNMAGKALQLEGVNVEHIAGPEPDSKFDLTLYVHPRPDELVFVSVYNAALFTEWRGTELLEQLCTLVEQIAQNPDERISAYSLVTHRSNERIPDPKQPLGSECGPPVHEQFARQASAAPDRLAVSDPAESWTYGELDARSNQLARRLMEQGLQPGRVVAIYAHRSASLVWSLLGVLKAGGAFLLLDPSQPASRLIECLEIARPAGWLQLDSAGALPDELERFVASRPELFRLAIPSRAAAESRGFLADVPATPPDVRIGANDPAYVAFTSGSTGAPKGILGTHGPLSHFLAWHVQTFGLNDSDRYSLLSGLAHDPLLRDVFTPLVTGAQLVIPDQDDIGSDRLARWVDDERITVAHLTPAMGHVLAGSFDSGSPAAGANGTPTVKHAIPSLRWLFFGGDRLTRRDVDRARLWAPAASCVNFYGTTETPQAIAWHVAHRADAAAGNGQPADAADQNAAEVIPLGRGIADVQLLLLNASGKLCGIGEVGEIHVRTPHLARGYIHDDAMTRERFLVNPFAADPNDRMYKTGDLGRYRPDGSVDFLGRADDQVKIRGYRVEPAEIESVLRTHDAVGDVLIRMHEAAPGDHRLTAYVVPRNGVQPSTREIRRYLKDRLPEFMVPSAFVLLDRIPLTPNGKIHFAALPAPEEARAEPEPQMLDGAPQTESEMLIAEIWRELLHIDHITVYDNFLDLGGHSLLGMEVIAQVEKRGGVTIKPRELMFQSLGQIAALCDEQRRQAEEEPEPARESGIANRLLQGFKAVVGMGRGDA